MSAATMWGGRLPLEIGRADSAPVIVGKKEQSPSDIWDSLTEGQSGVGMMMGWGARQPREQQEGRKQCYREVERREMK